MAPREIQAKNEQNLRVIQINQNQYYVESPDGKVVYKVHIDSDRESCTCENFQKISKTDTSFRCNHILAVKNCIPNGDIETVEHAEKRKPKLDDRFIKSIEGKDFVLYSGLLDLAHQKGLSKISVQILQYPNPENKSWAIIMATVESSQCTFSDIGDASPENCNLKIARHLIRMASTRAKARALRDFTNIGMTCLEELSGIDEVIGEDNHVEKPEKEKGERSPRKPRGDKEPKGDTKPLTPETGSNGNGKTSTSTSESQTSTKPENGNGHESKEPKQGGNNGGNNGNNNVPKMSNAQQKAIENLARRKGISMEEIDKMTREIYNSSFENFTSSDASSFIQHLQQNA